MEAWERYELADNAVKKFEATHEAKKKVIIDLAEILKRSGWSGVRFANPNSTHDVAREIQEVVAPDHEAIDPTALDLGGNVKQVVQQYQTLVAERGKRGKSPGTQMQHIRQVGDGMAEIRHRCLVRIGNEG